MSDFEHEVWEAFAELLASGRLRHWSGSYDAAAFGNAQVILAGGSFFVSLTRDRGDHYADIASRYDDANDADPHCPRRSAAPEVCWYPLEWTVAAVTAETARDVRLVTPAKAAALVTRHIDELERGLAPPALATTKDRLRRMSEAAMAEWQDDMNSGES